MGQKDVNTTVLCTYVLRLISEMTAGCYAANLALFGFFIENYNHCWASTT